MKYEENLRTGNPKWSKECLLNLNTHSFGFQTLTLLGFILEHSNFFCMYTYMLGTSISKAIKHYTYSIKLTGFQWWWIIWLWFMGKRTNPSFARTPKWVLESRHIQYWRDMWLRWNYWFWWDFWSCNWGKKKQSTHKKLHILKLN